MHLLLLLAQEAAKASEPSWYTYVLGPLGALCLLLVYAIYTEKYRIPGYVKTMTDLRKELATANEKADEIRQQGSIKKDELRKELETKEETLEKEISKLQDKLRKERGVRAWWQAQAEAIALRHGDAVSIPKDIEKTSYGEG